MNDFRFVFTTGNEGINHQAKGERNVPNYRNFKRLILRFHQTLYFAFFPPIYPTTDFFI